MSEIKHWLISVAGYGEWIYVGTEAEAEEMRAHKANWEGGIGKKRSMTTQYSDEAEKVFAEPWKERADRVGRLAEELVDERDRMLDALKQIKHSMTQAVITGNDYKRELGLSHNLAEAAIAEAEAK